MVRSGGEVDIASFSGPQGERDGKLGSELTHEDRLTSADMSSFHREEGYGDLETRQQVPSFQTAF
jgi:hypothetical protein